MHTLKLTQIGNSVGCDTAAEASREAGMAKGDTVYVIDEPDGVRLTVAHPEFAAHMDVACRVMKERRAVLRELAK
jgi:putative addiction module antidote